MEVHVAGLEAILEVFHNPPSIPPTQIVDPSTSSSTALTLPEVFPLPALVLPLLGPTASLKGPRSVQVNPPAAARAAADKTSPVCAPIAAMLAFLSFTFLVLSLYASTSLTLGTYPNLGSFVLSISNCRRFEIPAGVSVTCSTCAIVLNEMKTSRRLNKLLDML